MEAQKAWFITGASCGFGVEITREALQHGDRVVGMARNLQAVVEVIGEHPNLLAVKLEVTSEAGLTRQESVRRIRVGGVAEGRSVHQSRQRGGCHARFLRKPPCPGVHPDGPLAPCRITWEEGGGGQFFAA